MNNEVTFKLKEHDAWRLLALIKSQQEGDDPTWQGYWRRLGIEITDQIGLAYMAVFLSKENGNGN